MRRKRYSRMTPREVDEIYYWFAQDVADGLVFGVDVFQEECGDIISVVGKNGLPLLGFVKDSQGFVMIDRYGEVVRTEPALEHLLVSADSLVITPMLQQSGR